MENDILAEIWRNRDAFAKRHNYDLDAMVAALQDMERRPWTTVVDRRKGKPSVEAGADSPRE